MTGLSGQTVLVTGASRGIGSACARALAAGGARLVLHYSASRGPAEALAAELGKAAAGLVHADFTEPGAAPEAWMQAEALAGGRLDAAVLNHGIDPATPFDAPYDDWRDGWAAILECDLNSHADLAREAVNAWNGGDRPGRLVFIASRAGHRGDDAFHTAYAAAKGGVLAFMKTIARAYAARGVIPFAIAPGWVDTDMAPKETDKRTHAMAEIPSGRFADPAEIGRLAAFLLSGACDSAVGATFDVNGASHVR